MAGQIKILRGHLSSDLLAGLAAGILAAWPLVVSARLNVIASTSDLASIAREIGGDNIDLDTLAKPTEDPHSVDARPGFIGKLSSADVLIEGGAGLEAWLPALLDQAHNPKLAKDAPGHISCKDFIQLLEAPTNLDRSMGDIHAAGNPHYMVDPHSAAVVAVHLASAFGLLDPPSFLAYQTNLMKFMGALDAKFGEWRKTLGPYNGQQVVAYHNSWVYFAKAFGLKIDLFLEPRPGVPPAPAHLAEVIAKMKQNKIHVILVEPFLNRRTAEAVAEKTGATVVDVTQFPGGVKGSEGGYLQMMDHNVNSLAKALAAKPRE